MPVLPSLLCNRRRGRKVGIPIIVRSDVILCTRIDPNRCIPSLTPKWEASWRGNGSSVQSCSSPKRKKREITHNNPSSNESPSRSTSANALNPPVFACSKIPSSALYVRD
ncbi:hypothetical protein FS842_000272 [Serendipita sp. 407]|nr:hypothetical protein FS842_000272 [Serendipita sp. 407]